MGCPVRREIRPGRIGRVGAARTFQLVILGPDAYVLCEWPAGPPGRLVPSLMGRTFQPRSKSKAGKDWRQATLSESNAAVLASSGFFRIQREHDAPVHVQVREQP
jgi:hypothetical protein